ncbi:MAG: SPOR domain-containing protein, partial [Thiohalocapsa sp.]
SMKRSLVRLAVAVCVSLLCAAQLAAAPNLALDNILVSKTNGVTNVQIWPACRMRYVDHLPTGAGMELRIRVRVDGECAELLEGVSREVYLPLGRRLGNVSDVRFDVVSSGDTFITLRFNTPQQFNVQQHTVGWIEIFVDTNVDSQTLPANVLPPLDEPASPVPTVRPPVLVRESAAPRQTTPRREVTRRQVAPSKTGEYVVQLGVFDSVDRAAEALLQTGTPHYSYTTDFELNGRQWHGLQLGFFDSEATAELVLAEMRGTFPDSWVRFVNPEEAQTARENGRLRVAGDDSVPAVAVSRATSPAEADVLGWMGSGRKALIDRRYTEAIDNYTRVLEYPDHSHRADAREFIGVAHERSGQRRNAIAEYRAYLSEFPEGEGAARVESRLTSLLTATMQPALSQARTAAPPSSGWEVYGGVSQYYWRNEDQLVHDGNRLVSGSGVLALADVTATRRGTRFDVLARANGGYQFNLVDFDDTGDVGWLSRAFVDVVDNELGLRAKVGRQIRRSDGVIDRFDGAGLSYQWRPDV